MKTSTLFLIILMVTFKFSSAQNVNIPDTAFKNALLANAAINTNADDEIQVSEATAFTGEIDVDALDIADITGIEAFTNITTLRCGRNDFTYLDISNNTQLVGLYCINSYVLETLVFGTLPNLEWANCYGNKLTEIDVSGLSALQTIRCGMNDLVVLDLSNNPNLTTIDVRECNLLSLDVRNGNNTAISFFNIPGNINLTCVNVDDPTYSEANWTNVDPQVEFSTDCYPFDITFNVTAGGSPLSGAEIKMVVIEEMTETTDGLGQAIIDNVSKGTFVYQVNASGYKGIAGNLTIIDDNITVDIAMTSGETDTVNIPDDIFRNILLEDTHINANNDDRIQVTEAYYYEGEIMLESKDIEDLTGIEAFVNITSFDCSYNDIDTLDISNNIELEYFNCTNTVNDTLILGSNTNLKTVHCSSNPIIGLDVSELPSLSTLKCGTSGISSLDLSQNIELTVFDCRNSELSYLDMRNGNNTAITFFYIPDNDNLSCVNVDDVTYSTANWTNIDEDLIFSTDCDVSYDVTFVVTDGSNPIENAHIKFAGIYFSTNSEGQVIFESVGNGDYEYSIVADGFESLMSSLTISSDVTEDITLSSGAPDIVYIPDYQFRTSLLNNISINTNGDTEIQVSEAESYSSDLDVRSLDISDMTGIEAFINITSLNCNHNDIETLDVSNNTKLTELSCLNNYTIESLTLGNQPNLEYLNCYGNLFTELDVNTLTGLLVLRCGNTPLNVLDIKNNPNLITLDCRQSSLTRLDVRNGNNSAITTFYVPDNPNLSCISVDDTVFAKANWTDIDAGVTFSINCYGSDDATLAEIMIDGLPLSGFSDDIFSYSVELENGTTAVPIVSGTLNDTNAYIEITQAESVTGAAIIEVTAEDGVTKHTYSIQFSVKTISGLNKTISSFNIYPNPVKNYLFIEIDQTPDEITILNIQGELIDSYNSDQKEINISSLKSGIYLIGIKLNGQLEYRKFIKMD